MLRLFPFPTSQNASSGGSSDDKNVNEVIVWIQEHTNLCMAIACTGGADAETHERLKERLAASADRGKQLVNALLVQKGELPAMFAKLQEAAQNLVPVAGSARGRLAIPLSGAGGVRRLEEPAPSRPLRSGVAAGHAPTAVGASLTPSRTYLKKSGG